MSLAADAMFFAMEKHADQKRKYTNEPYFGHLAQVAGIVAAVVPEAAADIAVAWLHDVMEDQGVSHQELAERFGLAVAGGVLYLSDMEQGNRATRKRLAREHLAQAPSWIQTIKVADLISNTSSIVEHDPDFARVYLKEKAALLDVLTKAEDRLLAYARGMLAECEIRLREKH